MITYKKLMLSAFYNKKKLIISFLSIFFIVLLTLLPFLDQTNLITVIWIISNFYNNKLPLANVGLPGGPFFNIIWVPSYLVYVYSGFNLILTYLVWKIIIFFLYVGTGITLSKFFKKENRWIIFICTILNPAMILFSLIWMQFDIIAIFFSTLSMYLLYKHNTKKSLMTFIIYLIPMFIAIFTLYYPIIFLPSLFYYHKPIRDKKLIILATLILSSIFIIFDIVLYRGTNLSYLNNLNGNGLSSSFYQGFQFFVSVPLYFYAPFLVILSGVFPIILKRKGFGFFSNIYIILLIFLYTSASAGFDTYLWLFPFSILVLLDINSQKNLVRKILILDLPIFVEAFFSNFIMGANYQQGLFYFGYYVFHINYLFIKSSSNFNYFVTALNTVLFSSVLVSLNYLVKLNKSSKKKIVGSFSFVQF